MPQDIDHPAANIYCRWSLRDSPKWSCGLTCDTFTQIPTQTVLLFGTVVGENPDHVCWGHTIFCLKRGCYFVTVAKMYDRYEAKVSLYIRLRRQVAVVMSHIYNKHGMAIIFNGDFKKHIAAPSFYMYLSHERVSTVTCLLKWNPCLIIKSCSYAHWLMSKKVLCSLELNILCTQECFI